MPDFDPNAAVAWFLEKSKEHNQLAKMHEGEAKKYADMAETVMRDLRATMSPQKDDSPGPKLALGTVTPEQVRVYLAKKGGRVADLAAAFNVTDSTIRTIVEDPANGIQVAERGWLKLAGKISEKLTGLLRAAPEGGTTQ